MRIGFTITSYPPAIGGAQIHLHELARHLQPSSEVRVATLWSSQRTDWLLGTTIRAPSTEERYELDGVAVLRLGFDLSERMRLVPGALAYPFAQGTAVHYLAQQYLPRLMSALEGCSLVHNVRVGREPLSYASLLAARRFGVPFVFSPLHHPRWQGWLYRVYLALYRQADGVLALTNAERATLVQLGVQPERIYVTGVGPVLAPSADGERFRQRYGLEGSIILFLGQKYAYKGLEQILEAAPIIWQQHPNARFVFLGPRTAVSRKLFARHQDGRILELDAVPLQEKTDALAACSVLCVPSSQESFGGVYPEAWALGKPVIAADIPATREVIAHGQDGLLVAQQPGSIAEALGTLLDDPALCTRLGERGRAKVEERYRWDIIAQRTLDAYQAILRRSGSMEAA